MNESSAALKKYDKCEYLVQIWRHYVNSILNFFSLFLVIRLSKCYGNWLDCEHTHTYTQSQINNIYKQ